LSKKIRILLDESLGNSVAEAIRQSSNAISAAEYTRHTSLKGAKDPGVVAYATAAKRIVVTADRGMNEKRYPICKNAGIIIIHSDNELDHSVIFKRFLLSGHKADAKDAVTYLYTNRARIKNHSGEKVVAI
jgi:predicted nuclease of predicted toxin-antitoxin system